MNLGVLAVFVVLAVLATAAQGASDDSLSELDYVMDDVDYYSSVQSRRKTYKKSNARSPRVDNACDKLVYRRELASKRRALRKLQRQAADCGDVDKNCVDKTYSAIVRHKRALAAFRRSFRENCNLSLDLDEKPLKRPSCRRSIKKLHARRARLQASAARCDDEDSACVSRVMKKIVRVNKRIVRRRNQCGISESNSVTLFKDSADHVITESVWRHAISCEHMRSGFARWLRYMRSERKRLHDNACKCSPRDVQCLRERFDRIKAIQNAIRTGRTSYTELVTKCDKCAPLRLRFRRWAKLQNDRRKRLHAEICKCADVDTGCVTRRVERIKRIQQRIKDGRRHIFHMNEHCLTMDILVPSSTTTAPVTTTAPATTAPTSSRTGAGSMTTAGVAILLLVLAALLM